MLRAWICMLLLAGLALPVSSVRAQLAAAPPTEMTVAVADFAGADKELGRFLADALLTDLAQSPRLRLVERAEIRQALGELKLQATGLTEPQQVKQVGKLVGADRLVVGSYLVHEQKLLVNARLLDVRTGRVIPGGGASATGDPGSVLPLVHQLAALLHRHATGETLLLDGDGSRAHAPILPPNEGDKADVNTDAENGPAESRNAPDRVDTPAPGGSSPSGYRVSQPNGDAARALPATPNDGNRVVTERELQVALQAWGGSATTGFFTTARAASPGPCSRLRALLAILQAAPSLSTNPSQSSTRSRSASALRLPDSARIPLWALSGVSAAVDRGLWPANRALHGSERATRAFVRALLAHLPRRRPARLLARRAGAVPSHVAQARYDMGQRSAPSQSPLPDGNTSRPDGYTGLIVEARGLAVQRTMNARIVDENGEQVYPEVRHIPDMDYLQDHGMADFLHSASQAERAGARPLVVQAMGTSGDDVIVSEEAAARIRDLNRRDAILRQWRVCILLDEGR